MEIEYDLVQDRLKMLLKERKENNSPTHSMWTFNLNKNFLDNYDVGKKKALYYNSLHNTRTSR